MSTQKDKKSVDAAALATLHSQPRVVGAKQIRKALKVGKAQKVYLARNADPAITEPLVAACEQYHVAYAWVRSMAELGNACGIEVGAAAAAIVA
jgi:large subunit ribosomal protein L7A